MWSHTVVLLCVTLLHVPESLGGSKLKLLSNVSKVFQGADGVIHKITNTTYILPRDDEKSKEEQLSNTNDNDIQKFTSNSVENAEPKLLGESLTSGSGKTNDLYQGDAYETIYRPGNNVQVQDISNNNGLNSIYSYSQENSFPNTIIKNSNDENSVIFPNYQYGYLNNAADENNLMTYAAQNTQNNISPEDNEQISDSNKVPLSQRFVFNNAGQVNDYHSIPANENDQQISENNKGLADQRYVYNNIGQVNDYYSNSVNEARPYINNIAQNVPKHHNYIKWSEFGNDGYMKRFPSNLNLKKYLAEYSNDPAENYVKIQNNQWEYPLVHERLTPEQNSALFYNYISHRNNPYRNVYLNNYYAPTLPVETDQIFYNNNPIHASDTSVNYVIENKPDEIILPTIGTNWNERIITMNNENAQILNIDKQPIVYNESPGVFYDKSSIITPDNLIESPSSVSYIQPNIESYENKHMAPSYYSDMDNNELPFKPIDYADTFHGIQTNIGSYGRDVTNKITFENDQPYELVETPSVFYDVQPKITYDENGHIIVSNADIIADKQQFKLIEPVNVFQNPILQNFQPTISSDENEYIQFNTDTDIKTEKSFKFTDVFYVNQPNIDPYVKSKHIIYKEDQPKYIKSLYAFDDEQPKIELYDKDYLIPYVRPDIDTVSPDAFYDVQPTNRPDKNEYIIPYANHYVKPNEYIEFPDAFYDLQPEYGFHKNEYIAPNNIIFNEKPIQTTDASYFIDTERINEYKSKIFDAKYNYRSNSAYSTENDGKSSEEDENIEIIDSSENPQTIFPAPYFVSTNEIVQPENPIQIDDEFYDDSEIKPEIEFPLNHWDNHISEYEINTERNVNQNIINFVKNHKNHQWFSENDKNIRVTPSEIIEQIIPYEETPSPSVIYIDGSKENIPEEINNSDFEPRNIFYHPTEPLDTRNNRFIISNTEETTDNDHEYLINRLIGKHRHADWNNIYSTALPRAWLNYLVDMSENDISKSKKQSFIDQYILQNPRDPDDTSAYEIIMCPHCKTNNFETNNVYTYNPYAKYFRDYFKGINTDTGFRHNEIAGFDYEDALKSNRLINEDRLYRIKQEIYRDKIAQQMNNRDIDINAELNADIMGGDPLVMTGGVPEIPIFYYKLIHKYPWLLKLIQPKFSISINVHSQ